MLLLPIGTLVFVVTFYLTMGSQILYQENVTPMYFMCWLLVVGDFALLLSSLVLLLREMRSNSLGYSRGECAGVVLFDMVRIALTARVLLPFEYMLANAHHRWRKLRLLVVWMLVFVF
ncbi:MAG: hypothetical protein MHM6MM_009021, partial [Cercozoa sp. M6MM]